MSNPVLKVRVKKTGALVQVYKLNHGAYNVFLGEKISITAIENKEHMKTFEANEVEIVRS